MEFFNKWAVEFIALLMSDFKLDLLSAVAIVGNAGHESGGFKSLQEIKPLVPGSKGGYGIMQWTGPRRREAEAYWSRNNLKPTDMLANYKFLFVELNGPEGRVIQKLKDVNTLEAKVKVFSDTFLRPGIVHLDSRVVWAKRALAAWEAKGSNVTIPIPTQEPVQSDEPVSGTDTTPWWLQLILSLLRGFMRK